MISQELDMATASLSRYTPSSWGIEVRQELLLRLYEGTTAAGNLDEVLAAISEVLLPVLPFASLSIFLLDKGQPQLRAVHVVGPRAPMKLTVRELLRQSGLVDTSNSSHEKLPYDVAELTRRL